eukprot:3286536-Pleurochrysis_carterae.AAC.1
MEARSSHFGAFVARFVSHLLHRPAAGPGERCARSFVRDRRRLDSGSPSRRDPAGRRSPRQARRKGAQAGHCRRH